jgi:hypothetical protein
MRVFEYQVCNVQQGRVTFINGVWHGSTPLAEASGQSDPFQFCEQVWDYLRHAGEDGWELVSAVTHERTDASYDVLYLKRES